MTSKKKTNRAQIVKFLSVLLVQMTLFENDWNNVLKMRRFLACV